MFYVTYYVRALGWKYFTYILGGLSTLILVLLLLAPYMPCGAPARFLSRLSFWHANRSSSALPFFSTDCLRNGARNMLRRALYEWRMCKICCCCRGPDIALVHVFIALSLLALALTSKRLIAVHNCHHPAPNDVAPCEHEFPSRGNHTILVQYLGAQRNFWVAMLLTCSWVLVTLVFGLFQKVCACFDSISDHISACLQIYLSLGKSLSLSLSIVTA
jgi:hypothetical protein